MTEPVLANQLAALETAFARTEGILAWGEQALQRLGVRTADDGESGDDERGSSTPDQPE